MRLIDADAINPMRCPHSIKEMREWLAEMPTVEAIPIEWMKKFANERALNDGMDCYWHFWGADLLQMIELWEKENGSNSKHKIR